MNGRFFTIKFVLFVMVAFASPSLWAHDGLKAALLRMNHASPRTFSTPFLQTLAIADFDNDYKLDAAVLVDSGRILDQNSFRIEFHLSGSSNTELYFESTETALSITALDVNHDGATDVVIEQSFTHKRLYVWLNDGHGGFHKGQIEDFPSAAAPNDERMESLSLRSDCPAVCLLQQRGSEMTMLASCSVRGRIPSTDEFEHSSLASPLASRQFCLASSRASP